MVGCVCFARVFTLWFAIEVSFSQNSCASNFACCSIWFWAMSGCTKCCALPYKTCLWTSAIKLCGGTRAERSRDGLGSFSEQSRIVPSLWFAASVLSGPAALYTWSSVLHCDLQLRLRTRNTIQLMCSRDIVVVSRVGCDCPVYVFALWFALEDSFSQNSCGFTCCRCLLCVRVHIVVCNWGFVPAI